MKKLLLLAGFGLLLTPAFAQTDGAATARSLVREGVQLYDEGKYADAVAKYQQALAADPGSLDAKAEMAMTYNTQGQFAEAARLCEQVIKADPKYDGMIYIAYGNSLDSQKRSKEALKAYAQGISYFPDAYGLYYNQGVAQASTDPAAAVQSFQRAVVLNPRHASSHMSLGVLQLQGTSRTPSILALLRFLALEPSSARATRRLPQLDQQMQLGVSTNGPRNININVSGEALKDGNRKHAAPDNFASLEMVAALSQAALLGKTDSVKTEMERFSQTLTVLCEMMAEQKAGKNTGFTWEYYVPYFVELQKKGYVPALTYLVHSSQTDKPEVQQWLAAHPTEVQVFQEWSKNYTWPVVKQ